jgi:lysophospholipase L1-like esterase
MDVNHRWPNFLAARLRNSQKRNTPAVVDMGIAGNRLLHDGWGQGALARFDRDVLGSDGVSAVVLLEGINDIGFPHWKDMPSYSGEDVTANEIIAAYKQLASRAHDHGLKIYIGTLTPNEGCFYYSADGESKRQSVNR